MLSVRRLINLMTAVVLVAALFISFSVTGSRKNQYDFEQKISIEPDWIQAAEIREGKPWNFILVASNSREECEIANNLEGYLNKTKADFSRVDNIASIEKIRPERDVLVFCTTPLGEVCDLRDVESYVRSGGKIILAAGLPQGYDDAYLWPLLGIREKGIMEQCSSFTTQEGLLPLKMEHLNFEEFNNCTRFAPDPSIQIYMEEVEKKTPILYSRNIDEGCIGVVNSSILEYESCSGWFAALFAQMVQTSVVPALGIRSLILDSYPVNMVISDDQSMEAYGMNFEAFLVTEFLPAIQRISTSYSLPVICSADMAVDQDDGFVSNIRNQFETVSFETLRFGSELVFGAYLTQDGKTMRVNDSLLELFEEVLPSYIVCTLNSTGPIQFEEDPSERLKIHRVIAKSEEWKDGQIPVLSEGIDIEESRMFEIAANLAGFGGLIHRVNCSQMFLQNGSDNWDRSMKQLESFNRDVLSATNWLVGVGSEQAELAVQSYQNMNYTWSVSDDGLHIRASGLLKGQPFLVKTSNTIAEVEGATMQILDGGYYLIQMQENEAILHWNEADSFDA